jgi:hypothetical protein
MTKTEKQTERAEALASLKKMIKAGDTVYTTVKRVSASGMSRAISCYIVSKDKRIVELDWYISRVSDRKIHKNGGVIIGGCGMDMGFAMVYNLGRAMYPEGFKLRKGQYGRNGDKSGFDKDGGYAFNQQWM